MPDCSRIDPLVTPFVDGELPQEEQRSLTQHITVCAACRGKVMAERAIRTLMRACRTDLSSPAAPADLKARCARLQSRPASVVSLRTETPVVSVSRSSIWRARLAPFALAATLLLAVGGAFIYQATRSSSRVLAAELTLDHEKCFRLNRLLGTQHSPTAWICSWPSPDWGLLEGLPRSRSSDSPG